MLNAAAEFPFEISVDNHLLWIVASDGSDIQPVEVTSVFIQPGETMDVEIQTDQMPGHYWIRARIPSAGTAADGTVFGDRPIPRGGDIKEVNDILRYEGVTVNGDPQSKPYLCSVTSKCKIFNCPFPAYPPEDHKECIPMARIFSSQHFAPQNKIEYGLNDQNIDEHFFNHAYSWGSSINGNKFMYPVEPFSQIKAVPENLSCQDESCAFPDVGCVCTNIMDIPFNRTVQFVLTNFEPEMGGMFAYIGSHTIHLHGHQFAVLKMGFAEYNETTALFTDHNPDIVCPNRLCKSPRWNGQPPVDLNLEDPPIKNTVTLPPRGYVVIRFRSTNPGYWNMHCHASTHHMEGMNILFREASEKISPVPSGFPTCNKFTWLQQQFDDYLAKSKQLITSSYQDDNQNPDGEVHDYETEVEKSCKELHGGFFILISLEKIDKYTSVS